ncbi:MAG: hypothetical protein IJ604_03080 [Prevotella sp.]|nr:hypothetical protein [Prevotella sp.]
MKKKRILLIPMLLFAAVLTTGCSCSDDENDNFISYIAAKDIKLYGDIRQLYRMNLVEKKDLPQWVQNRLDEVANFPEAYVIKAKSEGKTIYIIPSLSSLDPWNFFTEDGSRWNYSDQDYLSDITIIYFV